MVELTNKVKEFFEKKKSKMSFVELQKFLGLKENEIPLLKEILDGLELEGYLYLNNYQEYMLFPKNSTMAVAELKIDDRKRPYARIGKNTVYIPTSYLNGALKGDYVLLNCNPNNKITKSEVTVKRIIKRQNGQVVFECKNKNGTLILEPYNSPFKIPIWLSKNDKAKLIEGDRLLVDVSLEQIDGLFKAEILNSIGHKDDPDLDIKTIAISHGLRIEFPEDVLRELEDIPTSVTETEIKERVAKGGKDLRDKMVFTIDGATAKDIDDAISIEILENGNYLLGVHIADVPYYVKEGSAIQREALLRGTSVYFIDSVIPMLPHKLSNGICSLNPNEDRMAKTCEIELDKLGNVIKYQIFPSVIKSQKKMAYHEVNALLKDEKMLREYKPFRNALMSMYNLSKKLNERRKERGFIDFGDNDIKIKVDQNGKPISVKLVKREDAEVIIENFMLLANEMVGSYPSDTFIHYVDLPSVYRVHEAPNKYKINATIEYLRNNNYPIKRANYQNPKALQELLIKFSECEEFQDIANILLRGLAKAKYSTTNIGHFGLSLENYSHFTAPIRRYPDLQTHYNIDRYTPENILNLNTDEEQSNMDKVCSHSSDMERLADFVERDINQYKMAELMESHINEDFDGVITYIGRYHISIRTSDHISGTLPLLGLHEMGYRLDDTFTTLINKRNGNNLRLGDKVLVTVKDACKEERKIIFGLKEEKNKVLIKKEVG